MRYLIATALVFGVIGLSAALAQTVTRMQEQVSTLVIPSPKPPWPQLPCDLRRGCDPPIPDCRYGLSPCP